MINNKLWEARANEIKKIIWIILTLISTSIKPKFVFALIGIFMMWSMITLILFDLIFQHILWHIFVLRTQYFWQPNKLVIIQLCVRPTFPFAEQYEFSSHHLSGWWTCNIKKKIIIDRFITSYIEIDITLPYQ